ncbi:hypothetical protein Ahy_A05g025669 [Arachis hypogaea]|uniref:Uncharacterized protein n=1 Tax=Arachis hypogaea TaxID=3818 RepID=A0A445D984_ARAHY|nr:hypothetical protein Ahy_A05g025669 [Arachis hypogaea]
MAEIALKNMMEELNKRISDLEERIAKEESDKLVEITHPMAVTNCNMDELPKVHLKNATIRASAVSTLAKFGAAVDELKSEEENVKPQGKEEGLELEVQLEKERKQ